MKKRILTIILSLAMLMTLCSSLTFSVSAAGNNPYICVPKTDASIAIDGAKGSDYDKAVEIPLERVIIMSEGSTIPKGKASLMWGADQKIYVYVEVEDADEGLSKNLKDTDPENTDCVEFYAYWGNGEPVCLYRITRDGVLYCQQNAHQGTAKLIDEQGDASSHFEAAVKETENGYAAEFKINTYLANLCEGALIAFKVVIASTDDVASYVCATSNYGCSWNAKRYHTKAATTPQTYANMMLVGADGADAQWHKYPSISVDDLDSNRYNADKAAQNLSLREATFINDYECIVKFSKACTLQWFNNTPVFMGACSGPTPAPEAITVYEEGKQWQIGFDLSSAVTNDGGITWKLKLDKPLLKYADGVTYAPGVFRISETQGADQSFYQTDNDFIGHVISCDGQDYITANKASASPDGWDVTYVDYTVNTKLTWDASKETPLPASNMDTTLGDVIDTAYLFTNPLLAEDENPDDEGEIGDKVDGEKTGDDGEDADFSGGKDKDKKDDKSEGGFGELVANYWWAGVVGIVVIAAIIVAIVLGGKKKKK